MLALDLAGGDEEAITNARLERFGLERLQEIARENGKKGGRPKKRP